MRATVASVLLLSACVDVASASHLCTSLVPRLMSTVRCHNDAKCMRHIGVQLCGGVATCTAAGFCDVCSTAEAEYEAALTTVQTCRESAECEPARPLVGTSCGCTRNLLASVRATDAEMAAFSAKKDVLVECFGSSRFISTCDCPARVPQCVAGRCAYSAALA